MLGSTMRGEASVAKRRAQLGGPEIFSGEDALAEVAKEDGVWNWALIGPDATELPLSGGGKGSVEEMRDAIGKHAHSFGLLRMTFGVGAEANTRYLFIHASDAIDSGKFSAVERGQAMAVVPEMDRAIRRFAACSARVHIQSKDECSVETMVEKLRGVVRGLEAELVTVENFRAAVVHHRLQHPEEQEQDQKKLDHMRHLQQVGAPRAEAAEPEPELDSPSDATSIGSSRSQRKKVKLFAVGDNVEIFSSKSQKWVLDAQVIDVTHESLNVSGFRVRAGSMKVVYDNGMRFKWVAPQQMQDLLRASPRPKAPLPLAGELSLGTSSWFGMDWSRCYFELNKGFLQWWPSQERARSGAVPMDSVYLLGMQLKEKGAGFRLRSDTTHGTMFTIRAKEEEAAHWVEVLWAHAKYCEEEIKYLEAKEGGSNMRKELLQVMSKRRFGGA